MPEAVIPEVGARVMGLNDPAVKMSKTHSDARGHAVALLDDPKEIERTFKRAVTDSGNEIVFSDDPAKAGVNNLLGIYKVVTGRSNAEVERDFEDARGYGDLKSRVAEVVIEELRPVQERYHLLIDDVGELDALMARGAEQAEAVSGPKIDEVKERIGLVLPGKAQDERRNRLPPNPGGDEAAGGQRQPRARLPRDAGRRGEPGLAYLKVARPPYSFLLESVEGGERVARYSFIGTEPYDVIRTGPGEELGATDPLVHVKRELADRVVVGLPEDQRFNGGAVGYLAYEAVRYFERLPSPDADPLGLPESIFMMTDTFVIFDHVLQKIRVVSYARLEGGVERGYSEAVRRIEDIVDRLNGPLEMPTRPKGTPLNAEVESNMSRREYESMVEAVKEYVVAGDVIQAVVAQRFRRPTSAHPFQIYRALRAINPSPYMYYLDLDGFQIVGASPELLVQVESGEVATHPIAGTRPRGDTPGEDLELEADLRADEKERAEHIMLVDLGRNDIGRVSVPGHSRGHAADGRGAVLPRHAPGVPREGQARLRLQLLRRAEGVLPGGDGVRRAQDQGHGDHRRAGAGQARPLRRRGRLLRLHGEHGHGDHNPYVGRQGRDRIRGGRGRHRLRQPALPGVRGDGTQGIGRAAGDRAGGEAIGPVGRAR